MREFESVINTLVVEVDGLYAAAVGGLDGLLIESFSRYDIVDLEGAVAEHAVLLQAARDGYAKIMNAPELREWMVVTARLVGYAVPVSDEYFLLCIGSTDVNLGQLRLKAKQAAAEIRGVVT
ncbi:roadblock/LC7 domain-containing protein [Oceanithermus sp.]